MLISSRTYNTRSMRVKTWAVLQKWLSLMEMKSITGTKIPIKFICDKLCNKEVVCCALNACHTHPRTAQLLHPVSQQSISRYIKLHITFLFKNVTIIY